MKKLIKKIVFDDEKNSYEVSSDTGTSVPEIIFAMSVSAKCLIRDGYLTKEQFDTLLNKYMTDPQYDEVKKEG